MSTTPRVRAGVQPSPGAQLLYQWARGDRESKNSIITTTATAAAAVAIIPLLLLLLGRQYHFYP